jgi:PhnB protein
MKRTDTTLNPYLAFNGNCNEAMTFYKEALDGELSIQTFGDSPMEVPPE